MTWLLIFGLLGWCAVLMSQIADLKTRIGAVERKQAAIIDQSPMKAQSEVDTPAVAAPPTAVVPQAAPPEPALAHLAVAPRVSVNPTRSAPSRAQVRAWLEQNGLAWAGGLALALGGLFLATYAAQRGMFTPPFRIAAAVFVGAVMLGVSEWLRRQSDLVGRGQQLAAAVTAGAGSATLYGAIWASYWIYGLIDLPLAGALMALVSLGLLGLSFLHGEPLAVLAIAGGFLAPMVTGPLHWAAPALTADLTLITATGYLVAGARRWGRAGMATLAGAAVWALAGSAAHGYVRVAVLAAAPVALAYLALEWRRRRGEVVDPDEDRGSFARLPSAGLVVGTVLLLALWFARATLQVLPAASVGAAVMAGLAAIGARRRLLAERIQAVGYVPLAGAALLFMRDLGSPAARELIAGALMLTGAGTGLWATLSVRTQLARLGATAGPLAALAIAVAVQGPMTAATPWAPAAALAILLTACAAVLARTSAAPQDDLPLAAWIWIAGAAALYALTQGFGPRLLPVAAAALAVLSAGAHRRLGWRGFAAVAIAAALGALGALLRPQLFMALQAGELSWWILAPITAAAASLVYIAARLSVRGDRPRETVDALSSGALLIVLAGLFLILRQQGMRAASAGGGLDSFFEASLRTVLMLAAGLLSALSARTDSSLIGRWRGQWLLLAGLAHGAILQLVVLNPLITHLAPRVAGPAIFDSLALGLLAPALMLAAATRAKVAIRRELLALYASAAGVFAIAWLLLEARRLFQGATLHGGLDVIGRAEACAYATVMLSAAWAILWVGEAASRRQWTITGLAAPVVRVGQWAAWLALALAFVVFAWGASPWWGPINRPLAGPWAAALLFAGYAAGGMVMRFLAAAADRLTIPWLGRAARLGVVVVAFALLNILVRYAFHGADMSASLQEMSLETWALSAAWGVLGFGLLVYGVARQSNDLRGAGLLLLLVTTAKIFLFDMARLEGVVRAGSFLAVGILLVAAAVIVRRLGGETLPPERRGPRSNPSDDV